MSNEKNILFTHSYFLRFDKKQWELGQPYAPLGTMYAAAVVREKGYNVSLFDTMFSHAANEIVPAIKYNDPKYFVIYDDGFNYLTKMCLTNMRDAAFEMIGYAKQVGCRVIISSSDSTDRFDQYLEAGADFIILGEGEQTISELLDALSAGENVNGIPGIAYKQNDSIIKTMKRQVMKDLDSLPFPAWDLLDITEYKNSWLRTAGYFSINIGTTRGCPFKCNWCAKPIYGNRYNARSPQHVIDELKMLKANFNFDHVWFCDDIFGLKPSWVNEFATLVEKEKLQFKFKIQSRADLLVQENYVAALARAGCDVVWMGAESGSQKILDAMDKGITIQQVETATALLKKHKIAVAFFIQFGYLDETKQDIRLTIEMINRLLPDEIGISVSYPLPGTIFFDKVKNMMRKKTNWTDSDELALMFSNTYQPAFYKQLHRYVHKSYRRHLATDALLKVFTHPASSSFYSLKKAASLLYYFPAEIVSRLKLKKLQTS
jgi:anaerobic magnesium-protoporphyrin IX monomethyl ester cyclase